MENGKLAIYANGVPLALNDDFSLNIELNNPVFNDTEMFSYPVLLPLDGNRHLLKNMDDTQSDVRPIQVEHTPMQLVADGISLANGMAIVQEDETLDDGLSLNIDAGTHSFQELIGDLKCDEVKIPSHFHNQLLIGEKIDEVNVQVRYDTAVSIQYAGKKGDKKFGSVGNGRHVSATISPQALGFSYPARCEEEGTIHAAKLDTTRVYPKGNKRKMPKVIESYINVKDAYPVKPFCNARVCYTHYDLEEDGTTSSRVVVAPLATDGDKMYEDNGKLWVLEADRPQSGICFYVLFFLDCLFENLGVTFDKSALMDIGDLQRLCFFTTKCAYDTEPLYYGSVYGPDDKEVQAGLKRPGDIKLGFFRKEAKTDKECEHLFDEVNEWLDSRGCGGKLSLENPVDKSVQEIRYKEVIYKMTSKEDGRFQNPIAKHPEVVMEIADSYTVVRVGEDDVQSITAKSYITGAQMSASVVRMYANERNFPAESVSTVLSSLENQFGIRFRYDYEQRKVTAYLIRDVFRKQRAPRTLHADVFGMIPISEKITGVRVGYSEESDAKEQKRNLRDKKTDYNTDFDYIEYNKRDTVTNLTYREILGQIHNTQMKLFVDKQTGNRYRVKIDADGASEGSFNPSLFEVGAYKGVEVGDCSELNKDNVKEFMSDFVPLSMVDVNYRKSLSALGSPECVTDSEVQPNEGEEIHGYYIPDSNGSYAHNVMSAFVEEDMEHEFVKQYIRNPISSQVADFYVVEELCMVESYNPSNTEDGNSPLQSYDWGLSIAVMRGGGADATHETYGYNYDGFGNSKWRTTEGEYALSVDSIDNYGNVYDYNGKWEGIGTEERFSLKPRAWVQPEWADAPLVVNDPLVKNRGYFDVFLSDYAYFLLHRKCFRVSCSLTVAQLASIPNYWRDWWIIGGHKCLINSVSAQLSVKEGLGRVELEVFSL